MIEWRANGLMGWHLNATLDGVLTFKSVLPNGGHGAALAKWHGGIIGQPSKKICEGVPAIAVP